MSLEELWTLFPITLTPHRSQWGVWAREEMEFIGEILSDYSPVINHIGSTAIPEIWAKPIIDILVEVDPGCDKPALRGVLEEAGYICMSVSDERMSFNKGYTPDGYAERVFHIHIRQYGDNDEIRFRDYLMAHPDVAKEYESLKLSLWPLYKHDRDAYTRAKSPFIERILAAGVDGV